MQCRYVGTTENLGIILFIQNEKKTRIHYSEKKKQKKKCAGTENKRTTIAF